MQFFRKPRSDLDVNPVHFGFKTWFIVPYETKPQTCGFRHENRYSLEGKCYYTQPKTQKYKLVTIAYLALLF